MKNTIVVLIVLLLSIHVFAQDNAIIVYPTLNSYLQAEKKNHGLLSCNNKQCDYKCFIELYNQQNHVGKKTTARRVTFMDGPVVYSTALPVEISRNANTLYQRYSASYAEPSAALQILGLVGGITAGILYHNYTGSHIPSYTGGYDRTRYLDNKAAIEAAYLQSTYFQHDK